MRLIPIDAVKDGAFLAQPLYNDKGQILLAKGTKISNKFRDKIKEAGFYTVYILDEYSTEEIEDIIKPEIRRKTIHSVTTVLNNISDFNNNEKSSPSKKKLETNINSGLDQIEELVKSIVDDVFTQKNVMINLVDIKNNDSYTYYHSVNVGILALVLGIGMNMNKMDLYDLVMGSLLHDVGKMFIPKEILNKKGKLSPEEFNIMKEHTVRGFNYLKDHTDLNGKVRLIALQHQEKVDGTGYPYNLKGEQIFPLSRIASIADVYDALTSDRPYRNGLHPNEAVEYIMGSGGRYFDIEMVKTFVRKVVPYPIGTIVKLSNHSVGIVEDINQEYILRPVIKIMKQNDMMVSPFLCDLKREHNIVIEGVVYNL
ncbi:HD-GYP domain-containing protein (c-di-GMP phosphodiesterase class II) [Anaerosolibacter carboniphilus]|uniref:HD-GYP domain-containing protein (C-di-GMP phosphodiesterase class II) n=1 Tax=Anaerosolibacter carboniphilus TaxID=1417629 RepID=A0A841KXG7_9FIRM|nr:HD-GYP domain-containing protein [Anaerosolibacter carboniphilus]MBB6216690.1 HD-GYP domain-containing protein (c-di-GMP phosphodiesterase class II) [Anaerosolibacter carboniphilus]